MINGTRTIGAAAGTLTVLLALASCSTDADQDPDDADTDSEVDTDSDADADADADTGDRPGERTVPGGVEQVADDDLPGDEHEAFSEDGDELGVAGLSPEDAPLDAYAVPAPRATPTWWQSWSPLTL